MGTPYLREAVEDWLAYLTVERQLAANTAEAYRRDISQFLAFLARELNRLPDMKQLLALQRATSAPSSPRGGAKASAAGACRGL